MITDSSKEVHPVPKCHDTEANRTWPKISCQPQAPATLPHLEKKPTLLVYKKLEPSATTNCTKFEVLKAARTLKLAFWILTLL
jgi:hypothetical protein